MTQSRLMEVARLRSIIQRMLRQHGESDTLEILRQAIESEIVKLGLPQ